MHNPSSKDDTHGNLAQKLMGISRESRRAQIREFLEGLEPKLAEVSKTGAAFYRLKDEEYQKVRYFLNEYTEVARAEPFGFSWFEAGRVLVWDESTYQAYLAEEEDR